MRLTLAFDIYGTLIDTHGVVQHLEKIIGSNAQSFSNTWRDKQLEYSFRHGLMQRYVDFSECTRQALAFTDQVFKTGLTDQQKQSLMDVYKTLPPFADAKPALQNLKEKGHQLLAFSNGSRKAVETLISNAGIDDYFSDIVSVEEVNSFKPDPAVYHHFLQRAASEKDLTWLISSNPFDVIGAHSVGINTAWIKRSELQVFDPWGVSPSVVSPGLEALGDLVN